MSITLTSVTVWTVVSYQSRLSVFPLNLQIPSLEKKKKKSWVGLSTIKKKKKKSKGNANSWSMLRSSLVATLASGAVAGIHRFCGFQRHSRAGCRLSWRISLNYSTVIFLFPSYLNLKTITWPGLVMTAPRHFVAESLSFSADFPHSYTYWKRATGMLERAWIEAKHAHFRVQAWLCWGWCVLSWPMNTCFLRPAAHTESTAPLLPRSLLRLTWHIAFWLRFLAASLIATASLSIAFRVQDCQRIPCLTRRFRVLDMTDHLLRHGPL